MDTIKKYSICIAILQILRIFVLLNHYKPLYGVYNQKYNLYDKGTRGFWKPNSFFKLHTFRVVEQRVPYFFKSIFFRKMLNQKKKKALSSEQLAAIQNELQNSYPFAKSVKVKRFYNQGKVRVRARVLDRKVVVTGKLQNIKQRFEDVFALKILGLS